MWMMITNKGWDRFECRDFKLQPCSKLSKKKELAFQENRSIKSITKKMNDIEINKLFNRSSHFNEAKEAAERKLKLKSGEGAIKIRSQTKLDSMLLFAAFLCVTLLSLIFTGLGLSSSNSSSLVYQRKGL